MIVLLQRVREASVSVEGKVVGQTGPGYLALVCAEAGDTDEKAVRAAEKTAKLRVFEDEAGRMNRSVLDAGGSVLAVSQFTLAADTRSGNRPGFSRAAPPEEGERKRANVSSGATSRRCARRDSPWKRASSGRT